MEIFNKNVEVVGSLKVNALNAQGTPSTVWTIVHNLDKRPSATVVDTAGTVVSGEISYVSNNEIEINFHNAFSGKAYLN